MDNWSQRSKTLSGDSEISSTGKASGSGRWGDDEDEGDVDDFLSHRTESGFEDTGARSYILSEGRIYNNTSWTYRFPSDSEEVIRQDRQHYLLSTTLPGLYRGPVDEVLNDGPRYKRILDVGCGTGSWTTEMAERFPNVDCVGIDLMPLQHDHELLNCTYMCVEVPQGLQNFSRQSFDLVHVRQMLYAIEDYATMTKECYRLLRPGGLILVHECQFLFYSAWQGWEPTDLAPALSKWMSLVKRGIESRGIDLSTYFRMSDILTEVGFNPETIDTHIHYRQICPDNPTSGPGAHEVAHSESFLKASRLTILEAGLVGREEWNRLEEEVIREIHGNASGLAGPSGPLGLLLPWGYWWARKDSETGGQSAGR